MKLHSDTYEHYKKSEGEWSDKVPFEWEEKRVKDLFRMVTQTAPANNDYELLSLYASIGVRPRKDLEARGNKASSTDGYWMVKKNDIVVNKLLAWMGSVGLSEYDGVTSPAYDVLRQVKPNIDPRYYAYLFRTETAKKIFRKNSRGIMDMRLRLYFDKLGAITVPVPNYDSQRAISNYLDIKTAQIEKKISLLANKAVTYKKLRRTLISNVVLRGLNENAPLKESDVNWIGKIPEHWEIKRIKETSQVIMGQSPSSTSYVDEGEGEPFMQGNAEFGDYSPTAKVWCNEVKKYAVDGDILLSVRAPVGAVNVADGTFGIGRGLCAIRSKKKNQYKYYLTKCLTEYFNSIATGSTYVAISVEDVRNTLTPNPPALEQQAIAEFLDARTEEIDLVIKNIEMHITKLNELRIAMINDAVTGKIKVINENITKEQVA